MEIKETERIKLGLISKSYNPSFFARKTVAEKLQRVSKNLPTGLILLVIEGYRSTQDQQNEWDKVFQLIKQSDSSLSDAEIELRVRQLVALPLPLANHHCGGAIDVALAYSDGTLVDMGTPYISSASVSDKSKFPMLSREITASQASNRKFLRDAMDTEDFVWYPGEWWHYCWGDRMWAVYSNQINCFYGSVEL